MSKIEGKLVKFTKFLNEVACWVIVATMVLVVANVLVRAIFKSPLLGAYEYTGFLTALFVGLSLAYCAVINGHIAVDFIIEKFSKSIRKAIDMLMGILAFSFLLLLTWRIFVYASQIAASGQVSPTTQTPFYVFVYMLAFSFFTLSLVQFMKTVNAVRGVFVK